VVAGKRLGEAIPRPSEGPQRADDCNAKIGFCEGMRVWPPIATSDTKIERVMKRETHGPAAEKRSFRGELDPRKEQAAPAKRDEAEAGSSSSGETKCVFKRRKKKSKRRMERNAERMRSYVQRMARLRVPGLETGDGGAFTFVCAVIRGFQKTLRTIFEDGAQVERKNTEKEEHSEDERSADSALPPSGDHRR
jgi:hypothetical protein